MAGILNVTVTQPAAPGFLTVYPGDSAVPTASNLNFSTGQTVPNLVVVKLADRRRRGLLHRQSGHRPHAPGTLVSSGKAADYNRWRETCSNPGSLDVQLMTYVTNSIGQYRQALVTGFNYDNPIRPPAPGSGSGVFVHYQPAGRSTTGCVGVNDRTKTVSMITWLKPTANPQIVIRRA